MEKNYRLFLKNLPTNINETKIKKLFENYVNVINIDLKEKKNPNDSINKFAFVNVSTTDQNLQTCFNELHNKNIDGFQISVELAKESFLERLKRERNENQLKETSCTIQINQLYSNFNPVNDINITSKSKNERVHDSNLSFNDFSIKEAKSEKNKNTKNNQESPKIDISSQKYSEDDDIERINLRTSCDLNSYEKQEFFKERCTDKLKFDVMEKNKTYKNEIYSDPNEINNNTSLDTNSKEDSVINESEKKRLMSFKQKRQKFKMQKQTIYNDLKFIDKNRSNKKIVFNDSIEVEDSEEKVKQSSDTKNTLFNSDDEDQEQFQWNEDELDTKAKLKQKLHKLQKTMGNDKRFVLDERFLDDEGKVDEIKHENEDDQKELDEKKWQLNILGNVLGKSISTMDNKKTAKKKNRMVRYDPTAINHQDYELIIEKPKDDKSDKKKHKKQKKSDTEEKNDIPIPVSNELFYDVSDSLVKSLQEKKQFSLLQAFGRDTINTDNSTNLLDNKVEENTAVFQFNSNAKKFKYDSSDSEDNEEINEKNIVPLPEAKEPIEFSHRDDRLFFYDDDPRFDEAKNFFKRQSVLEEDVFKYRRRELKEIVRSKIRKNLKKSNPWNKKKIRKIQNSK